MNPDKTPGEGAPSPGPEVPPASSLSEVRVKRRRNKAKARTKSGDLTQASAGPAAPRQEPSGAAQPPRDRPASLPLDEDAVKRLLDPPERRAVAAQAPAASELREPLAPKLPEPRALELPQPQPAVDAQERQAPPTQPDLRLVAETPSAAPETSKKGKTPPADQKTAASSIDEIIDYWDSLRGDHAFPALAQLDRALVGKSWPNTLLVGFGESTTPRLTRLSEANDDIEYTEMVIHWILSRAQQAARRSEPMEEEKRFPVSKGQARYQLLLLPLGTAQGKSDQVLCHLCRGKELSRGAAFKRWLAS
jgi:hypothetical protein